MFLNARVDILRGMAQGEFAQGQQVALGKEVIERVACLIGDIDLAVAKPLDQVFGRQVDQFDRGILEHLVGYGISALTFQRTAGNQRSRHEATCEGTSQAVFLTAASSRKKPVPFEEVVMSKRKNRSVAAVGLATLAIKVASNWARFDPA